MKAQDHFQDHSIQDQTHHVKSVNLEAVFGELSVERSLFEATLPPPWVPSRSLRPSPSAALKLSTGAVGCRGMPWGFSAEPRQALPLTLVKSTEALEAFEA